MLGQQPFHPTCHSGRVAVACRGPSTRPIDGAMGAACGDRITKAILKSGANEALCVGVKTVK